MVFHQQLTGKYLILYISRELTPEMLKSLERIIDIWSQRGVYDAGVIEKLQASLGTDVFLFYSSDKFSRIMPQENFGSKPMLFCAVTGMIL